MFRSGIAAVVGRPNVGKSTLVNTLMGEKVAIVSDKPQTTRSDIRAILTTAEAQVVITDTPGFHRARTPLGMRLNHLVGDAVDGADVIMMVVDAASGVGSGDAYVYREQLARRHGARFCVVNKIDRIGHHDVVPRLAAASELGDWDEIVPVSSREGAGVDVLLEAIVARLPHGPALYPQDAITDQPIEAWLAELVREQALAVTREEVPHSVAVVVDELVRAGDITRVYASIVLERESQKGILIGHGGATLKAIGTQARRSMAPVLGTRVFLDLRVKVMKDWQRDPRALDRLGF
jgi:GTPase